MPLVIHFLNVGQGDCTIIEFPSGRIGVVDIDNLRVLDKDTRAEILKEYRETLDYQLGVLLGKSQSSLEETFLKEQTEKLTDPLAYYDANIGRQKDIFRFIVTHPDMDHMTGLHRIHEQDGGKSIANFWHTGNHDFNLSATSDEDWEKSRYDKRDWETYKKLRKGDSVTSLQKYQGNTGEFWTEDGIEIWAPTTRLEELAEEKGESNILSMIIKITYKGRSVLLGGDATAEETWEAIYPKLAMDGIDVLKASHHGRKTGYYWPAVKEMSPWLTITSVGEAAYDATNGYRRYSEYTVSLRKTGDITITIDDEGILHYPVMIEDYWKPKKAE